MRNYDEKTVAEFGQEWSACGQCDLSDGELPPLFDAYFAILPWTSLTRGGGGAEIGCGSGRCALKMATRVVNDFREIEWRARSAVPELRR